MTRWCRRGFRMASESALIIKSLIKYLQIHIAPEDQHKTTFTFPFTFTYTRMPFGLCNALSTF
ncbi:hypothetical protein CR513_17439, partial [Mucuna pruriens]